MSVQSQDEALRKYSVHAALGIMTCLSAWLALRQLEKIEQVSPRAEDKVREQMVRMNHDKVRANELKKEAELVAATGDKTPRERRELAEEIARAMKRHEGK